ncbi:MAG TPA: ABC transporter ATP-binding protein [Tepidisphaeraceae bacterium]|jgi:subfamily B ATP-binding cassette protein MsbA|nr:ABC transporter ATP-binding protein [Tepidisphaeraceae bacterium]
MSLTPNTATGSTLPTLGLHESWGKPDFRRSHRFPALLTSALEYLMGLLRDKSFRRLLRQATHHRGLLALTVIAGLVNISLTFVIPWLIGSAIDEVIVPGVRGENAPPREERLEWLTVLVGIGLGTALMFAIITYCRGHYTVKLGNRIITDTRRDLFDHLQRLSLHFYSRERTGSIVSRLINDIQQAGQIINGGVIVVCMDFVQTLIAVVLLFSVSWQLTLACLAILPFYAITFKVFDRHVREASDRVQVQISKLSGNVQERLSGIALVKTHAAEDREKRAFDLDTEEHYGRVVRQSKIAHMVGAISEGLVHCGTMIVIGYGGYLTLYGNPPLTAGDVTRFLGWLGIMYGPVRRFAELNVVYQTSMAALDRVYRVFDITPKIADRPGSVQTSPTKGVVAFENVRFCYHDDSEESRAQLDEPTARQAGGAGCNEGDATRRYVLDNLSFNVSAGERVALVGPSGSGKSTIVSLIPRLYDVTDGRIVIDGIDVRDYSLRPLRQAIGIVQQDSFVFSGTIRDNLAYGKPDATDDEVIEAAKAANAHEFISRLPKTYQTPLGERGVNLSGGQRQRLSIARAILKDPRILILDEATSALDTESESLVQSALDQLMQGRTCFIIAHRLSTIRNADRILVIEAGQIVEVGNHRELIEKGGLYAKLVRQQFGTRQDEVKAELALAAT